ncbi:chymotrypsin-C-like [Ixodes scapularis]
MYVAGWGYTEPLIRKNQSLSEDMDGSHAKEDLMTVNSGSEKKSQEVTEDTTEYFDYEDVATPGSSFKNKFPDMLQEARVRLIPNEECDKLYNDSSLHGNIVCAMHDFGSICSGDSGGPLVYKTKDDRWTLMGLITATELPCNVTDLPMYFVRIKSFMDNFILPCHNNFNNKGVPCRQQRRDGSQGTERVRENYCQRYPVAGYVFRSQQEAIQLRCQNGSGSVYPPYNFH